jgi:hypothetical protein
MSSEAEEGRRMGAAARSNTSILVFRSTRAMIELHLRTHICLRTMAIWQGVVKKTRGRPQPKVPLLPRASSQPPSPRLIPSWLPDSSPPPLVRPVSSLRPLYDTHTLPCLSATKLTLLEPFRSSPLLFACFVQSDLLLGSSLPELPLPSGKPLVFQPRLIPLSS